VQRAQVAPDGFDGNVELPGECLGRCGVFCPDGREDCLTALARQHSVTLLDRCCLILYQLCRSRQDVNGWFRGIEEKSGACVADRG
jgi:hypothetical protein